MAKKLTREAKRRAVRQRLVRQLSMEQWEIAFNAALRAKMGRNLKDIKRSRKRKDLKKRRARLWKALKPRLELIKRLNRIRSLASERFNLYVARVSRRRGRRLGRVAVLATTAMEVLLKNWGQLRRLGLVPAGKRDAAIVRPLELVENIHNKLQSEIQQLFAAIDKINAVLAAL